MTKDDIIRMAREAGFRAGYIELYRGGPLPFIGPTSATDCMPELVRFAAIVAAAEREACKAEVETLRAKIEEMEKQEPDAWCATDETETVIEALGMNKSRRFDTALYLAPGAKGE